MTEVGNPHTVSVMFQNQHGEQKERERGPDAPFGARSSPDESPLVVIVRLLAATVALLSACVRLVRREGTAMVRDLAGGLMLLGAAALVAVLILGLALTAAILILSLTVKPWAAVLIVLGASVLLAWVMVVLGVRQLRLTRLTKFARKVKEDLRRLHGEIEALQRRWTPKGH